jgi:hypothetical protein
MLRVGIDGPVSQPDTAASPTTKLRTSAGQCIIYVFVARCVCCAAEERRPYHMIATKTLISLVCEYRELDPPTFCLSHAIRHTLILYTLHGRLLPNMRQQTPAKCGSEPCYLLCGEAWAYGGQGRENVCFQAYEFIIPEPRNRRIGLFRLALLMPR